MIVKDLSITKQTIAEGLVLDYTYCPPMCDKLAVNQLSNVAQRVFWRLYPRDKGRYVSPSRPEIVALRLLDYLSSKQGYIRRRGPSFRNEAFYLKILPDFIRPIMKGEPISLHSVCAQRLRM